MAYLDIKSIFGTTVVILVLSSTIFLVTGCYNPNSVDHNAKNIYNQLPDHKRIALVPNSFKSQLAHDNIILFHDIENIQIENNVVFSEEEFYIKVRQLNVQYIIVSSDMMDSDKSPFPWIRNKRFKICPGDPDNSFNKYYVLLVWDNSRQTFSFFKYLYNEE